KTPSPSGRRFALWAMLQGLLKGYADASPNMRTTALWQRLRRKLHAISSPYEHLNQVQFVIQFALV
ncbi:hypothetical protein, partial [Dyella acidisoli]|uniref:hypothetical protein n=1 Tax=Dyella acidisoli TaxID=1867834 RepID=UPI0024E0A361